MKQERKKRRSNKSKQKKETNAIDRKNSLTMNEATLNRLRQTNDRRFGAIAFGKRVEIEVTVMRWSDAVAVLKLSGQCCTFSTWSSRSPETGRVLEQPFKSNQINSSRQKALADAETEALLNVKGWWNGVKDRPRRRLCIYMRMRVNIKRAVLC